MAGTEAIADQHLTESHPWCDPAQTSLARPKYSQFWRNFLATVIPVSCFTLILGCLVSVSFAQTQTPAAPQRNQSPVGEHTELLPEAISAQADALFRWQIGDALATLLEGNVVIQHPRGEFRAGKVLIVTDGPRGQVRNRVVIENRVLNSGEIEQTPRSVVWTTRDDPKLQVTHFRGKPQQQPFLLQYLPDASIERIAAVDPAGIKSGAAESDATQPDATQPDADQHQAASAIQPIQFTQPIPDPNVTGPMGSANTIPPPPSFATQVFGAPTPAAPIISDPSSQPPAVFDDGASSRPLQFFVGGGTKSFELLKRDSLIPPQISITSRPEFNESIIVARGGITVQIRDVRVQLPGGIMSDLGTVTLSAERVVGWLPLLTNMFNGNANLSDSDGELYLEGDIVLKTADQIIYAESMYYNINRETAMILDAEAITKVPEYQGVVRLKAEVLQQISRGNFQAFDAAVTSSRMGVPRYWLQSEQLQFTQRTRNRINPKTKRLEADTDPFVTANNSFVFLGGVPIFYWPRFSTSLERPTFYITGAKVKNDDAFGTQVLLDWDLFQLLSIESVPEGVDWELSTDYLSDRGPALGTSLEYNVPGFLGRVGQTRGQWDLWGINDDGLDRLGRDRLELQPEKSFRGRAFGQHRQQLSPVDELIVELGAISDRNFMEQYLESEWDQRPDANTGLRYRRYHYNQLLDISANVQVNDFFQETEQLPSINHYLLGGSIFGNRLTWNMHNKASYSRLNAADTPENPAEAATYSALPGESNSSGTIVGTRQELAVNLPFGPFMVRPVASIDATHYGEAADGDSLTRIVGQGGVQLDLPMFRVDPTIQSQLLNVNGMAHKMNWKAEYWYADSDTNLDELPLYDPLDDDAQEQFRRRFIGLTYGGTLPSRFDPRTYAFRQGIQRYTTSPSDVIADDLQQLNLGLNQRFQTKRGLPGSERIVDLVQLDIDTILFPNADRDNFGESVGPTRYDFRYHLGDRFSVLSDGYVDWFDDGLRSVSAGLRASRPGVTDLYLGLLSLEGPISSTVFRATLDYRMNEKWIFSGGTTYDFGEAGNIGQSFGFTRIGESFLVRMNLNVDPGRDNASLGFLFEPRFLPNGTLGNIAGGMIPPPGLEGLE